MTAAAPELLSFLKSLANNTGWSSYTFGGMSVLDIIGQALAAYDDTGRLWRDVAADLAAKLAEAEQYAAVCNSGCEKALQMTEQASAVTGALTEKLAEAEHAFEAAVGSSEAWKSAADRAEVAAQEAMLAKVRELLASAEREERETYRHANSMFFQGRRNGISSVLNAVRAFPIPAAKPEGE